MKECCHLVAIFCNNTMKSALLGIYVRMDSRSVKLSTKKYSHKLKGESYFTWWECLQLQALETASQ